MKNLVKIPCTGKIGRLLSTLVLAALLPGAACAQAAARASPSASASASSPAAAAAPRIAHVAYNRSIVMRDFAGIDAKTILGMQRQLETIYHKLPDWRDDAGLKQEPLNDGVVGPVTLDWLQRYAFNFKFASGAQAAREMPAHMARMAQFAEAHAAELDVLLDARFEAWDAANPAPERERDYAVRRQGEAAPLLALVERYRAGPQALAAPLASSSSTHDDGYYNYVLSPEDLDRLGAKADSFTLLATLKDKPYPTKEALRLAMSGALKGRDDPQGKLWKAVDQNVRPFYGHSINADSRAAMKAGGMTPEPLAQLASFGSVYLKTRDDFDNYITAKIAAGDLTVSDPELVLLADKSREFNNYHLDQPALDTIARQLGSSVAYNGVPELVVQMLRHIKDVDYPDRAIFNSAARSKIAFGLGMCQMNGPVNNAYAKSLAISDEALAALLKQFETFTPRPALDLQKILALRREQNRCTEEQLAGAEKIVAAMYQPLQTTVESVARKNMPERVTPARIDDANCGCALEDLGGVVYGFYPWWWQQDVSHAVNFRALNRVAFYGLTVDHAGELHLGADAFDIRDGRIESNGFVNSAHRYNAKVDWLIQKGDWSKDWRTLTEEGKKAVFKRLLANITTLLTTPLGGPAASMKRLVSFGAEVPRRGDGVTLYFPNYPTDNDAKERFNEFYDQLRSEMDRHKLWLNILVTQDTLTDARGGRVGAFGLPNLIELRKKRLTADRGEQGATASWLGSWGSRGQDQHVHENHEYLMVLLNEPSAEAKKNLRRELETDSYLHGAQRADFLHSMLPVVQFDDGNWQQLDDDLVYARFNFGGVGLWAPDLENMAQKLKVDSQSCLESKQIVYCLLKAFSDDTVADSRAGWIEKNACIHREALQLIMVLLLLTGAVVIALFFRFCKVQNLIKKYFLWVQLAIAVPALLVFILLLLYDPAWLKIRKGNLPFFISAAVIMIGIGAGYRFWRAQRQVPRRERGMPQREGVGFPILVWSIDSGKNGFQWLIKNRGTGYAIIKKVEILLDGQPVADARTALESVMASDQHAQWKSIPLVGQKLEPGKQLVGLSIPPGDAAAAFEQKLKVHALAVKITYSGPNNEHWSSDGTGIVSVAGVA